jgi:lysophospholipase L1-like esterase
LINLDRVLPVVAPLLRRALRTTQTRREALFAAVPIAPGRVVFLGDSITEMTDWGDWFPELRTINRGIGGQAIGDVTRRLDTALIDPKAISLLIGTNDLHGLGTSSQIADIAAQMRALVGQIRNRTPDALLIINAVLPRSPHFTNRIVELNRHNRSIAQQCGAIYLDTMTSFAGPQGAILPELTIDGLHLSVAGYVPRQRL